MARSAPPIVLMLACAQEAEAAQRPAPLRPGTGAESFVCHTIRRGESATRAARRLTGDSRNTYQASFQIMNPSSRFIPKSQYDRIRAGWRACVIKAVAEPTPALTVVSPRETAAATATVDVAGDMPWRPTSFARARGVDLTIILLGASVIVPVFGWRFLDDYLARRKTATLVIQHFADRFVREFERPLVRDDAAAPPVRSRFRRGTRQRRFDILFAPGEGRRYPNLSDHKKNVEYDVSRVMQVLADDSFVTGPPYSEAGWVVVPFQFLVRRGRGEGGRAGLSCISSL